MKSYPPDRIRNVALVGHGGAGKTTLAEALLFTSGSVARQGRVEDGTTVCDHEPEAIRRGMSTGVALAAFEHDGHKINVLDCPGFVDLLPEVAVALRVADLAVVVVSAVDGVEAQTEAAWSLAEELGVPRMIFVNKEDRDRASFDRTLDQLRAAFGPGVAPLELPLGEAAELSGVADLLTDTAIVYDDDHGHHHEGRIPPEMASREHEVHDTLVEGIVEQDEELLERYLDGDVPTADELERTLAASVAAGEAFPVICGSALRDVGVDQLTRFICEIGPAPTKRPPVLVEAGDSLHEVTCDPDGPPLAFVWKTITDRHVGRISLLKVVSGTLRPDTVLVNPRTRAEERLHSIFTLRGKEHEPVESVLAGDLVAVAKLGAASGDTLAPRAMPVVVSRPEPPDPTFTIAVTPRSRADEEKLMTALHRLEEEDLALRVKRDDETHQTLLSGMGETHLQVALERLQRKAGVEVVREDVRLPYRETVTAAVRAEGRHKKQSGGHGQFGVCTIEVEPLERGAGFEFVDRVVGGAIPRQFIPAVERGVRDAMAAGGPHGFPVVDLRVTLVDGRYHAVDSSEMSFRTAGSLALQQALAGAGTTVLEPMSRVSVTVPFAAQGDVLGDLNARRARVLGTAAEAGSRRDQVVEALVPTSELQRYAIDLRSLTSGRGSFKATHSHYDVLPSHLVDGVIHRVRT